MKKTIKKLTAVGLTLTSVMGLVACGSSDSASSTGSNATEKKEITMPTSFTVMADGTVVVEENGGKEFYAYLEKVIGLPAGTITWVRPPHASYYDAVKSAFTSGTEADVCILSSDYYSLYAANGMLWDMTEAWANSETKNSGRLISTAESVMEGLLVNGEDGKKAMYAFTPCRGNGCCTYVKKAWLDKAGIPVSDVEGKTLDFNTYYGYLKKMAETYGHFVISAPGFVSNEAPYTNYLPEFFQKAQYSFYQSTSGQYVDGFTEKAMEDALSRIAQGVADGVIDKASNGATTAEARNKFGSSEPATESGVFTYWAGTWANTLKVSYLEKAGLDGEMIALNPIKELGKYTERLSPVWAITKKAQNPEGIFKYFIDTMLDGGDVQIAWMCGAKGTHWDTKAESVTVKGKEDKPTEYKEGEFHWLPAIDKPTSLMSKNHEDPMLVLGKLKEGVQQPPLVELAKKNGEWFANNCEQAKPLPMTDALSDYINDINKARGEVVSKVALGEWSIKEGMDYYNKQVGSYVKEVLASLNK